MTDETAHASRENPQDNRELSRARYEEALGHVEAHLRGTPVPADVDLLNEMRIIRLVSMHRVPWYGMCVDPEDSSVTVGVMMRNAFEAVGDAIDYPTDYGLETKAGHWFTKLYLPRWRRGKREYLAWLDTLGLHQPR